ncbi:CBS domain-containing protein [Nocardia pseudobrasiliensis]|uniref:CBS domain protein n=1 Tax=Nocardia pseudobrasiliensis TaxID=45979 RepID=A0A370HPK2_9NOCA|nr:CBS domain-containing protein [Nocardia pseudobrasiliensis]RDI60502.1 CBS domain protein [Nocardia pseudobrasiliensis]
MTTARDLMQVDVETIAEDESLAEAARRMRAAGIGALPICDRVGTPVGIVTDRDIIIKCVAVDKDPARTSAGSVEQDVVYTVDVDTDLADVLAIMEDYQIRRLPVTEDERLVGIITEADVARALPEKTVGEFVAAVCAP